MTNGEDFVEPLFFIFGVPIYAFMANVCYTVGPLVDRPNRPGVFRVTLFKIGMLFSAALTMLPGLFAILAWILASVYGHTK